MHACSENVGALAGVGGGAGGTASQAASLTRAAGTLGPPRGTLLGVRPRPGPRRDRALGTRGSDVPGTKARQQRGAGRATRWHGAGRQEERTGLSGSGRPARGGAGKGSGGLAHHCLGEGGEGGRSGRRTAPTAGRVVTPARHAQQRGRATHRMQRAGAGHVPTKGDPKRERGPHTAPALPPLTTRSTGAARRPRRPRPTKQRGGPRAGSDDGHGRSRADRH